MPAFPKSDDPSTNTWSSLSNANNPFETYPYMYVLQDGRVIHVGELCSYRSNPPGRSRSARRDSLQGASRACERADDEPFRAFSAWPAWSSERIGQRAVRSIDSMSASERPKWWPISWTRT